MFVSRKKLDSWFIKVKDLKEHTQIELYLIVIYNLTFNNSLQISNFPLAAASCKGVNFHKSATLTQAPCWKSSILIINSNKTSLFPFDKKIQNYFFVFFYGVVFFVNETILYLKTTAIHFFHLKQFHVFAFFHYKDKINPILFFSVTNIKDKVTNSSIFVSMILI